ncbi:MAG: hypothetical protein IJQ90_04025 [Alphaproteobacteria bacterium]|nr:hypothetical protein [Alphaproteobacteria bacterium]
MADNDNFEEKEIQSDDPIIQKCLDIIRNKNVIVKDLSGKEFYRVYIGDEYQFSFHKYDEFDQYQVGIDFKDWFFYKKRPDLEELYRLCATKYNEQALKKEEKTGRKPLTPGQITGILFMLAGLTVAAVGVINYKKSEKTQRVNKQVEAYEKTLPPEYLEYKQAVEHYRDSLMHTKGK